MQRSKNYKGVDAYKGNTFDPIVVSGLSLLSKEKPLNFKFSLNVLILFVLYKPPIKFFRHISYFDYA